MNIDIYILVCNRKNINADPPAGNENLLCTLIANRIKKTNGSRHENRTNKTTNKKKKKKRERKSHRRDCESIDKINSVVIIALGVMNVKTDFKKSMPFM